jgi:hypothetical protein
MRLHTNHFIRFAYWAIAVGGAALVFVPFAHAEDNWLRPAGWTGVVVGLALLFLFDRRPALEEESQRIRQ